tara:strand:- start:15259 stop:15411 length:153 start_codon:yes stop_codon:yes gene_type:complete
MISEKVLYALVGLNVGMFILSFILANTDMMTLNILSALLCYVGAKFQTKK